MIENLSTPVGSNEYVSYNYPATELGSLRLYADPYNEWLDFVLAHDDTPHVISTSYGDNELTGMPPSPSTRRFEGQLLSYGP